MAAARGESEMAEQLIKAGVNLDMQDEVHITICIIILSCYVNLS